MIGAPQVQIVLDSTMTADLTFEAQAEALRRLAAVDWEVDLEVDWEAGLEVDWVAGWMAGWVAGWVVDLEVGAEAVEVASKVGGGLLSGEGSALMVLWQRDE